MLLHLSYWLWSTPSSERQVCGTWLHFALHREGGLWRGACHHRGQGEALTINIIYQYHGWKYSTFSWQFFETWYINNWDRGPVITEAKVMLWPSCLKMQYLYLTIWDMIHKQLWRGASHHRGQGDALTIMFENTVPLVDNFQQVYRWAARLGLAGI